MKLKVSVIVTAYNVEQYIEQCISSIVKQVHRNLQIIAVDDGSTDSTPHILDRWAKKDDRITVIRQANRGPGIARNTGIDEASGKYICFVDGDDWLDPGFVDALYMEAERTNADMVISGAYEAHDGGRRVVSGYVDNAIRFLDVPFNWKSVRQVLLTNTPVWDKIYRADFLRSKQLRFISGTGEDIIFKWQSILNADKISLTPEPYYYYRVRAGSITTGKAISEDVFHVHELVRNELVDQGLDEQLYAERAILEIKETVYLTRKAARFLLSNEAAFDAFYDRMRDSLMRIDLDRMFDVFPYIDNDLLFRTLYIRDVDDRNGLKEIMRRGLPPSSHKSKISVGPFSIQWGSKAASNSVELHEKKGLDGFVKDRSSSILSYPGLSQYPACTFEHDCVTLIAPPDADHGHPAIATLRFRRKSKLKKIHFMVFAFQPERYSFMYAKIDLAKDSHSRAVAFQTRDLPIGCGPRMVTVDIPDSLSEVEFELRLSVSAVGDHAYCTGVQFKHFVGEA